MGDGGELERALDDVYGTGVTVRSCCEKRFEKKLCKNKFGQVKNLSTSFCICLVS